MDFKDSYLRWLLNLVGLDDLNSTRYNKAILMCFSMSFKVFHPRDKNRLKDGLTLRDQFLDAISKEVDLNLFEEREINDFLHNWGCSILEVLIKLAIRADLEYCGDPGEPKPEAIFWEMMENLFGNRCEIVKKSTEDLGKICVRFVKKEGPTPFPCFKKSQRGYEKWELWRQMTHYFFENGK